LALHAEVSVEEILNNNLWDKSTSKLQHIVFKKSKLPSKISNHFLSGSEFHR